MRAPDLESAARGSLTRFVTNNGRSSLLPHIPTAALTLRAFQG